MEPTGRANALDERLRVIRENERCAYIPGFRGASSGLPLSSSAPAAFCGGISLLVLQTAIITGVQGVWYWRFRYISDTSPPPWRSSLPASSISSNTVRTIAGLAVGWSGNRYFHGSVLTTRNPM
jgi:hypothetical protein